MSIEFWSLSKKKDSKRSILNKTTSLSTSFRDLSPLTLQNSCIHFLQQGRGRQRPGPSFIKQLKINWEFLQPFPVLRGIFLQAMMDKAIEGGLKNTGNAMMVQKNLPEHRK